MDALLNVFGQIQHAVAVLGDEAALNADLIVIVLAQADALGDALFAEPVGEFAALAARQCADALDLACSDRSDGGDHILGDKDRAVFLLLRDIVCQFTHVR